MKITKSILIAAAVMLSMRTVRADDAAVSSFVNDSTVVVVRFDLKKLDPQATLQDCGKLLAGRGDDARQVATTEHLWQQRTDNAQKLIKGLGKAGATQLYWVLSAGDLSRDLSLPGAVGGTGKGVWIVPVESSADRPTIASLITANPNNAGKPILQSQEIGNTVVAAKPGRQIDHDGAALSPEWAKALASTGPIVFAAVPGQAIRRSFEENLPAVQTSTGSLPVTQFTRGVRWISISISGSPSFYSTGVIECADASAASTLSDSINGMLKTLKGRQLRILDYPYSAITNADEIFACKAEGTQVHCEPNVNATILPLVVKQMHDSVMVTAQGNMRQILLGSIMYMNQHREFAPSLEVMLKEQEMSPSVLIDPLHPEEKEAWVYVKPAGNKLDPHVPLLYEKSAAGVLVGFTDGHVETRPDRASVMKVVGGSY